MTNFNKLMAAAFAAMFSVGAGDAYVRQARAQRRAFQPAIASTGRAGRGPGWTHAHARRVAAKRRNVLRNRRAHRG